MSGGNRRGQGDKKGREMLRGEGKKLRQADTESTGLALVLSPPLCVCVFEREGERKREKRKRERERKEKENVCRFVNTHSSTLALDEVSYSAHWW